MRAIVVCASALFGMAVACARPLDPSALAVAGVSAGVALLLTWRARPARLAAVVALFVCIGALRASLSGASAESALSPVLGRTVLVDGSVASQPEQRGETVSFDLAVERVTDERGPSGPTVLVPDAGEKVEATLRVGAGRTISLGDAVALRGRMAAPTSPAGFPRAELLRRRGVVATMSFPTVLGRQPAPPGTASGIARLRSDTAAGFNRYLPAPQAGLAFGSLLGGTASFDADFKTALQAAGLGHIVAVSGYNVVVAASALAGILTRTAGRRWSLVPLLLGIAGYTALTGAPPSAVRAALMVGTALVASAVGRVADPLTGVLLAATAMAAWSPGVLQDVGFQLSFAATLGLVLLSPHFLSAFARLPRWIGGPLAMTMAAQVATAPIVAATFHQVSIVAPLTNVLAAPVVPLLMAGSAVFAVTLPWPGLTAGSAWLAGAPASVLAAIIRIGALAPHASVYVGNLTLGAAVVVGGCAVLWGLTTLPEAGPLLDRIQAWRWSTLAPLAASAAMLAVAALAVRPDGLLHVRVLAAGAGQAFLVRGPDGSTVLVSGSGPDPRGLASLVGDSLRAWEHQLGVVVLLGPNDEPLLAETLRRYPAGGVVAADRDLRLDVGGASLDVAPGGAGSDAAITYGGVWIKLAGRPIAPGGATVLSEAGGEDDPEQVADVVVGEDRRHADTGVALPAPREGALELVSDGVSLWWIGADADSVG